MCFLIWLFFVYLSLSYLLTICYLFILYFNYYMGKIQCVSSKPNDEVWQILEKRMEEKQTQIDIKIYEEYPDERPIPSELKKESNK
jgi:hypothetical protein